MSIVHFQFTSIFNCILPVALTYAYTIWYNIPRITFSILISFRELLITRELLNQGMVEFLGGLHGFVLRYDIHESHTMDMLHVSFPQFRHFFFRFKHHRKILTIQFCLPWAKRHVPSADKELLYSGIPDLTPF